LGALEFNTVAPKEGKPQQVQVAWSINFALLLVKFKAQTPSDETANGTHGALNANVNVAVVGV